MNFASHLGSTFDFVMRTPDRLGTHHLPLGSSREEPPAPVLLIPGFPSIPDYLKVMQRSLRADGIPAYIMAAPNNGLGDAREAAKMVAKCAALIQRLHGSSHVNFVGHSRGGILARDAAAHYLPRGMVQNVVTLGSPHHGVRLSGILKFLNTTPYADWLLPNSRWQMLRNSTYVQSVGMNHDARLGFKLLNIYYDTGDGVTSVNAAHVEGAQNLALSRRGWFPHLQIVTHDDRVYDAVWGALQVGRKR